MRVLAEWVQPQHLDERNLAECRRSFGRHPAAAIVLTDFLVEPVTLKLYKVLSSEAECETRYGLYSKHDEPVSEREWRAAADEDRFYKSRRSAACGRSVSIAGMEAGVRRRARAYRPSWAESLHQIRPLEAAAGDQARLTMGGWLDGR